MSDGDGRHLAEVETISHSLAVLREEIEALVVRLADTAAFAPVAEMEDREALIDRIDRAGVEARRLEALLARQIVQLDEETAALLASLDALEHRSGGLLPRLLGAAADPEARRQVLERRVAEGLARLLLPSDALIVALDAHAGGLKPKIARCEAALDQALAELKLLPPSAGAPGEVVQAEAGMEALSSGIDRLQDLVDGIIDMLVCVNVLRNKLYADAEERVLLLIGLSRAAAPSALATLVRLKPVVQRAEQGLLSLPGIRARRQRLNDLFYRRMSASRSSSRSASRQAGAG